MSEHLSFEQVQRYRLRVMTPSELLSASDHIAVCGDCRRQLGSQNQLRTSINYLRQSLQSEESDHISYDHLAEYADLNVDGVGRRSIESHLKICEPCATEAENLRALKADMTACSGLEYATRSPLTPSRKLAIPHHRIPLQIAATTTLALVIAWGVTLPWRKQVDALRAQVNLLQQASETLQAQASAVAELQSRIAQIEQAGPDAFDFSPQIASVLYDDSRQVTIDQEGNITGLEFFPPSIQQSVKAALRGKPLKVPSSFYDLGGKAATLMGTNNEGVSIALVSPIGTVIKTDRPTLRWRALKGATSYVISVYDSDFKKVAMSPPLSGTEWTVPQPLSRGGVYSWQIRATKEGKEILSPTPPAQEAKFKVLEQAKLDEIERIKQAHPSSHLILGIVYVQNGLLDGSAREFNALLRANPKSAIARKLASSVWELRRGKQ